MMQELKVRPMRTFADSLKIGLEGERKIGCLFISRGYHTLPVVVGGADWGHGPRLFCKDEHVICPDMQVWADGYGHCWLDAKHKTDWSFHYTTKTWNTGIDEKHRRDYEQVATVTGIPVLLAFLHTNEGRNSTSWFVAPAGLYVGRLDQMKIHHKGWIGNKEVAFWEIDSLKRIATIEEVESAYRAYGHYFTDRNGKQL